MDLSTAPDMFCLPGVGHMVNVALTLDNFR